MLFKRILVLIILFSTNLLLYGQEVVKLKSEVISAVVTTKSATVTREAKVDILSSGEYVLIFPNIISDFVEESIQISGKGTAEVKILDVKIEEKHSTEFNNIILITEQRKIDSLKSLKQIILDKITILESQKNYIDSIRYESAKLINRNLALSKQNLQDLQDKLDFFEKNLNEIYNEIRDQKTSDEEINNQIKTVEGNIRKFRTAHDKIYKDICVTILSEQPGELILKASYLVMDASWEPIYDARIFSEEKKLDLSYFGMVKQNTGEDWKNINLTLSTARPLSNKIIEKLDPMYLYIDEDILKKHNTLIETEPSYASKPRYRFCDTLKAGFGSISGCVYDNTTKEPLVGANIVLPEKPWGIATDFDGNFVLKSIPAGKYILKCTYLGYNSLETEIIVKEKDILIIDIFLNGAYSVGEEVTITAQARGILSRTELQTGYADVILNQKENFSTFDISAKYDIPGDNLPHKVNIATIPMNITFEYKAAPVYTPNTFLICKAANNNEYTLAEGEVNLFLEDDYLNKCYIQNVAPSDTFNIYVGTDEMIKADKKFINRYTGSAGFLTDRKSITYEYEIIAVNNSSKEQKLTIVDLLPFSQNEEIVVKVLDPEEDRLNMDQHKIITWTLNLKPGEKKVIPFKYSVTVPSNMDITGLE